MKGKSASKQASREETNKVDEQPHLSGAYIRSLVKQLTSTRTKDPVNSKDHQCLDGGGEAQQQQPPPPQPPPPSPQPRHKKQVRRRLHTSRPYQERLLNMAEARREIVTALKFHRAAMKQQQEQQQQEEADQLQQMALELEQENMSKSRRNQRIYASQMNNFPNHADTMMPYPSYVYPSNNGPYPWPLPPVAPPLFIENINFTLPNQPLGLNLNLQDFSSLDGCFYQPPNFSAASFSSVSSSSPPLFAEVIHKIEEIAPPNMMNYRDAIEEIVPPSMMKYGDSDMHHAVDDEEMAEIRSIGEQHEIEWNDTLNFVTSACWFKFLKAMEMDPQEEFGYDPFDQVMELPSWLNANETCLDQNLNDYCSDDYMQDPALPGMEIEEIEAMDGEWLS